MREDEGGPDLETPHSQEPPLRIASLLGTSFSAALAAALTLCPLNASPSSTLASYLVSPGALAISTHFAFLSHLRWLSEAPSLCCLRM